MSTILCAVLVMGICGITTGVLLGLAEKAFAVEENSLAIRIRNELPGNNCGGCGYAGCDGFAEAVASGRADYRTCVALDEEHADILSEICGLAGAAGESTGADVKAVVKRTAHVKCVGLCERTKNKYIYSGIRDCSAVMVVPGGGEKACDFGCIGYGSCVKACSYGAISLKDGTAYVDENRCVGCGKCINECPKGIIELIPRGKKYKISCSSHNKGKQVKDVCTAGCIGCGLCVRSCRAGAIRLINNLPVIDYSKCVQCGKCKAACVSDCIE